MVCICICICLLMLMPCISLQHGRLRVPILGVSGQKVGWGFGGVRAGSGVGRCVGRVGFGGARVGGRVG